MKDIYGIGLKEYPSSGHFNDVFIITPNRIEIFVETIWTSTKSNFQRDLNILHRSTASVKILIVNPNILKNTSLRKDFEKTRISERQRGIAISDMIDGSQILNDPEFVNVRFVEIVKELVNDVQMKKGPLISPSYIPKLKIINLKMNVVNGDLRVNCARATLYFGGFHVLLCIRRKQE